MVLASLKTTKKEAGGNKGRSYKVKEEGKTPYSIGGFCSKKRKIKRDYGLGPNFIGDRGKNKYAEKLKGNQKKDTWQNKAGKGK